MWINIASATQAAGAIEDIEEEEDEEVPPAKKGKAGGGYLRIPCARCLADFLKVYILRIIVLPWTP